MKTQYITDQNKIAFVLAQLRYRVARTGLADTPACHELSKTIDVSAATLLKALKGEFTKRTVTKMIVAGWFDVHDYRAVGHPKQNKSRSDARHINDRKTLNEREKAAFKRGYEAAKTTVSASINGAMQAAYDRGFDDGKRQGYLQGKRDGRAEYRPSPRPTTSVQGMDIDRLTKLFNMTVDRGAGQGEMVAARRAAGKTIAKWIRDKFGQDVQVNVS